MDNNLQAEAVIRPRNFTDTATDSDLQNADNYLWLDTENKAKKLEITRLAVISSTAATEADMVAGSMIPIKTAAGPKSLPGNVIAKASDVSSLQASLLETMGLVADQFDPMRTEETKYLEGEPVIYKNKLYVFLTDHYGAWNQEHVGNPVNLTGKFVNRLKVEVSPGQQEYFVLYNNSRGLRRYGFDDLFNNAVVKANQKTRLVFNVDSGKVIVYGKAGENSNKLFFKFSANLNVRGTFGGESVSRAVNMTQLATELSVSLVNDPLGNSGFIELANGYSLVYSTSDQKYHIRAGVASITPYDVILISNRNAEFVYGVLQPASVRDLVGFRSMVKAAGTHNPIYIERVGNSSGGSIYFKLTELMVSQPYTKYYTMQQIADACGVTLVTSPKGVVDCIELTHRKSFVVTISGEVAIKPDANVDPNDVVMLSCLHGEVGNDLLAQFFEYRLDTQDSRLSDLEDVTLLPSLDGSSADFAETLSLVTGDCETFLFFSDIHCYGNGTNEETYTSIRKRCLEFIKKAYRANAVSKVICGGDILTSGDTPAEAIKKLGNFFGTTSNFFDDFIVAKGNHEVNERGTEDLTVAQQDAALFSNRGKAYYKVEMPHTDCYVLDTGDEDTDEMTAYRWQQLDWLANQVLSAEKSHAIVLMHIYSHGQSTSSWVPRMSSMATNLQTMLSAINSKGSCTLNNITYNFASVVQKFAVILCGHGHIDVLDDTHDVPSVSITSTFHSSDGLAIDACVLDYGTGKLRMTRLGGYGENRVVDIVV